MKTLILNSTMSILNVMNVDGVYQLSMRAVVPIPHVVIQNIIGKWDGEKIKVSSTEKVQNVVESVQQMDHLIIGVQAAMLIMIGMEIVLKSNLFSPGNLI